jgi:hypothetical protein
MSEPVKPEGSEAEADNSMPPTVDSGNASKIEQISTPDWDRSPYAAIIQIGQSTLMNLAIAWLSLGLAFVAGLVAESPGSWFPHIDFSAVIEGMFLAPGFYLVNSVFAGMAGILCGMLGLAFLFLPLLHILGRHCFGDAF